MSARLRAILKTGLGATLFLALAGGFYVWWRVNLVPVDGGYPLRPITASDSDPDVDHSCQRHEFGKIHYSVQHCQPREPLDAQRTWSGIINVGFEAYEFYPGARAVDDLDEGAKERFALEIDHERLWDAVPGTAGKRRNYHAVHVTIAGRRTSEPFVDCHLGHRYTIIADRIVSLKYVGEIPITGSIDDLRKRVARKGPQLPPLQSKASGRIGELERAALALCSKRAQS